MAIAIVVAMTELVIAVTNARKSKKSSALAAAIANSGNVNTFCAHTIFHPTDSGLPDWIQILSLGRPLVLP